MSTRMKSISNNGGAMGMIVLRPKIYGCKLTVLYSDREIPLAVRKES